MSERLTQHPGSTGRGWLSAVVLVGVLVAASLACVLAFAQSASRSTAASGAAPSAQPPAPPPAPRPDGPQADTASGDAGDDGAETVEPLDMGEDAAEGLPLTEFVAKDFTVGAGRTAAGDRYFVGNNTDVEGTIDGDFYTFGKGASIPGRVTGDLNSLSSNISITGVVEDDVRALSGDIMVRGRIGGDLMALSGEVRVARGARVAGRTLVFAGHTTLDGDFAQPMNIVAGEVNFGGHAHGDVKVESDQLSFSDDARIDGNLTYSARQELESLQGDRAGHLVGGKVTFVPKKAAEKKSAGVARYISKLWSFIATFVIGSILILIAKRLVQTILVTARTETLKSIGFGMLGHILVPFVGLVLLGACLFLGFLTSLATAGKVPPLPFAFLPAGFLMLAIWAVLFYLSKFVVSAALGDTILRSLGRDPSPYTALIVGMVPIWILLSIPVLGPFLYLIVVPMLGIGAILVGLRAHFGRRDAVTVVGSAAPFAP